MAYKITEKCISCGACAGACPVSCISQGDDKYVSMRTYASNVELVQEFAQLRHQKRTEKIKILMQNSNFLRLLGNFYFKWSFFGN